MILREFCNFVHYKLVWLRIIWGLVTLMMGYHDILFQMPIGMCREDIFVT